MPQTEAPTGKITPRPIDIRRAATDREGAFELSVFCPVFDRDATVDACGNCDQFRGLLLRSGGEGSFIKCVFPAPTRAPAPRPPLPASAEISPRSPGQTPVSEAMTTAVVAVPAELSLRSLTELLIERGISGAPVIDKDGAAIGVVSKSDLVLDAFIRGGNRAVRPEDPAELARRFEHRLHTQRFPETVVGDIMTPVVYSVTASTSLSEAATLMATERIHRLVVIDPKGRVVGLLSTLDILRWIAFNDGLMRHD